MQLDMTALEGNRTLLEFFDREISAGTLAHAYTLEGIAGSGKHTTALLCAEAISYGNPAAEKIRRGVAPDIFDITLQKDRKTIGVETIRTIRENSFIKPTELDIKVFIISDANLMTAQAQNALLKLLEEPPRGVYFFLLCTTASTLLPTVISRAPILRMQVFSDDEMRVIIRRRLPAAAKLAESDEDSYSMLLRSAGGSLGEAMRILTSKKGTDTELYKKITSLFDAILAGRQAFVLAIMALPNKREELSGAISYIILALRDMLAAKYCAKPNLLYFNRDSEAIALSERFASFTLLQLEEAALSIQSTLETNVNVNCIQLELALQLWNAYEK